MENLENNPVNEEQNALGEQNNSTPEEQKKTEDPKNGQDTNTGEETSQKTNAVIEENNNGKAETNSSNGVPGAASTPKKPDCNKPICYRDLGVQLGLLEGEEQKSAHANFLKNCIEDLNTSYESLNQKAQNALTEFRNGLKNLVIVDLKFLFSEIDQQERQLLERTLSYGAVIDILGDEDLKGSVKDFKKQLHSMLSQARSQLNQYQLDLKDTFPVRKLESEHNALREGMQNLLLERLQYFEYLKDLEDGYQYGRSVKDFVSGKS